MKTSGWVATVAAGAVLIGGGAYAVTTLGDEPEDVVVTPEVTVEPTPTSEVTPEPTPEPVETVAVEYTEAEDEFLYGARQKVAGYVEIDDPDLLAAGYEICAEYEAWVQPDPNVDRTATRATSIRVPALAGLDGTVMHNDINSMASTYLCPDA